VSPNAPRDVRTTAPRSTVFFAWVLLFTPLAGCQHVLVGHWRLVEVVPSKQVFSLDDATFNRDGTYAATTTLEGKTTQDSGTYRFNGYKLILHPQAGGRRTYNAVLKLGRLEITSGQRKVVLQRGS